MENFFLFNLLRALGGASAGADGENAAENGGAKAPRTCGGENWQTDNLQGENMRGETLRGENFRGENLRENFRGGADRPPPRGGQANMLAGVLERHEQISNRIKSKSPRPPHGQ